MLKRPTSSLVSFLIRKSSDLHVCNVMVELRTEAVLVQNVLPTYNEIHSLELSVRRLEGDVPTLSS